MNKRIIAAIVRKDPKLTDQLIDEFCRASQDLAAFKRPRHYFFVDEIPSNPTGKVERGKLKDLLMKGIDKELE